MAFTVRTQVYRQNVRALYQRGGPGYRWLDRVRLEMHRACERGAPVRSSELRKSHRSSIRGTNQYHATAEVENTAEHAEWVHEGVPGRIYPRGGKGLKVPVSRGATQTMGRKSVRGQAANPWMERACSRVAMSKGAFPIG